MPADSRWMDHVDAISEDSNLTMPADSRWMDLASVADSKATDITEDSSTEAHPPRHLAGASRWVATKPDKLQQTDARAQATLKGCSRWLSATPSAMEGPMQAESFEIEGQEPNGARQHLELYMQLAEDEKQAAFASFDKGHGRVDNPAPVATFGIDLESSVDLTSSSDTKGDLRGESIQYVFDPESDGWGYELDEGNPVAENTLSHGLGGVDGRPKDSSDVVPHAHSPLQVQQILQSASVRDTGAALQPIGTNVISQAAALPRAEPHFAKVLDSRIPALAQGDALEPALHARLPQETHNLSSSDTPLDRGQSDVGELFHVQGFTPPDFSHTAGGLGAGSMSSQRRQVDDVQHLPARRVPKLPSPFAHAQGGRSTAGRGARGSRDATKSRSCRRFAAPPVPKLPLNSIETVRAHENRGDSGAGKRHRVSETFDDRDRKEANLAIGAAAARPPQLGVRANGAGMSSKHPPTPANSSFFRTPTSLPSRTDGVPAESTWHVTPKDRRGTSPLHQFTGVCSLWRIYNIPLSPAHT